MDAFGNAHLPADHPLQEFLTPPPNGEAYGPAVEQAVAGVADARRERRGRRGQPGVTREQHAAWRAAAELNGDRGEELGHYRLCQMEEEGVVRNVVWASVEEDFYTPYDLRAKQGRIPLRIEVKSTAYEFEEPINISLGELEEAANCDGRYELWRFYQVTAGRGILKICSDLKPFAQQALAALGTVRHDLGLSADKLSFPPGRLTWSERIEVVIPRADR